jgi:neutral amino acid transport system ATP-binding protein
VTLLRVDRVRKAFRGVEIVHPCSIDVARGEIIGLIGPNGAGKTTLFKLISGEVHPDEGSVEFAGRKVSRWSPERIAQAGLVRTFQVPALFNQMSVIENLLVAAPNQIGERLWTVWFRRGRVRQQEQEIEGKAWEVLRSLKLEHVANSRAAELSGGQKKLLELARALMTRPAMMLLDEPVAGVHPNIIEEILEAISELRDSGYTFLIIEHKMDFIFRISDRIYVMADGAMLTTGTPPAIRADQRVLDAYLGVV